MGEIKSTLDLVMERTRNLTLSDAEKLSARIADARKAFNGILHKYRTQQLRSDQLQREMTTLRANHAAVPLQAFQAALADSIDLVALEGPLPPLFKTLFGKDASALLALGQQYRQELSRRAEDRRQTILSKLMQELGVSGSAVVPNLDRDPMWQKTVHETQTLFNQKLAQEKAKLT